MALSGSLVTTSGASARQSIDANGVACCYFRREDHFPALEDAAHPVREQGILVQLCERSHHEALVVITSHQLFPSVSSARQWLIGFNPRGAQRKEFSLADCIDQHQLELITCCGDVGEQHCLWNNRREHVDSKCPMHSDCTVLLLGESFSRDIIAEFGEALHVFSLSDCMDLKSVQEVLLGGQMITVYYRTTEIVLHSPLQIQAPPRVDSSHLLSAQVDWYHNHYSTFSYKPAAMLPVTGAPVIYCETNTGKPWLLGMHVCLPTQSVQYGVSFSHILELLQCHLNQEHPIHTFSPIQLGSSHVSKLSLLDQAVHSNLCTPRHYDNLTNFLEKFSCKLTDLLQITHCITNKQLLFAHSNSHDDVEIRRASLRLLEILSKLFKQFDTPLITATIDGVREWCPSLTTGYIHEAFWHLYKQLAFSIIPDQKDATMVKLWFSCWSNLLCLNVIKPICHFGLLSTFHECQSLHPDDSHVQQCFGQIMICLSGKFQTIFEQESHDRVAKQEAKDMAELTEQVKILQEQVKQLQVQKERQAVGVVHSELSAEKLYQQVRELERENGRLQEQVKKLKADLASSERSKPEMQNVLPKRYPQLQESVVKKQTGNEDCSRHPSPTVSTDEECQSPETRRSQRKLARGRSMDIARKAPSIALLGKSQTVPTMDHLHRASNDVSVLNPPLDPAKEEVFKRTIKDNYRTFVRSTNFTSLAHLLKHYSLISDTEYSKLVGVDSQLHGNEKANYFYLELLDTKGNKAYTLFWHCLTLEMNHLGHKELLDLLNKAVEGVEMGEGEEDGRTVNE